MSRPSLIGITGKARAGKDTLAHSIIAHHGGYRYGFADPIKQMLKAVGIDFGQPFWQMHKETPIPQLGVSPRYMMQTLGTEWGREMIHPSLWTILAENAIRTAGPGAVVSDVRFESEAEWVRARGGVIIHLYRSDAPGIQPHKSEAGIAVGPHDIELWNSGTVASLDHLASELFRTFHSTGVDDGN